MQGVGTPRSRKSFWSAHSFPEAQALLSGAPYPSGEQLPTQAHPEEPRSHGPNSGRALELSGFDLTFVNSSGIKSRVLVYFVVEWTPTPEDDDDVREGSSLPEDEDNNEWTLYFHGSF